MVQLYGVSTQGTEDQRGAVERLHLPFPLLSDAGLRLVDALRLPTMAVAGMTLCKRLTLAIRDGVIVRAFYPVFPPDAAPGQIVSWLKSERKPPANARGDDAPS